MEVSGRKETVSVDSGKAVIFCQPCQSDNESVQAEGYCETCNEFICTSCIKAHQKLAVTKNHVIKNKDEMPTIKTQSDQCTELCAVHKTEIVKFYCEEHDCVGCGDCMVLEHKSCKVQLVSGVSGNYSYSDELIRIKHNIDHLKKNLAACKHEITQSLKVAEETKTKVVEEIKKFREEMNIYLNQVEADLIKEVEKISSNNISNQKRLQDQCESMESEMKEFQSKLDKYSDKMNQLFVTSTQIKKWLKKYQEENVDISIKSQITTCIFEPSKDMNDFKVNMSPLGKFSSQTVKFTGPCQKSIIEMKAHFVEKVNIQAEKEGKCCITGMAMISGDTILMADNNNFSLKCVNVKQRKIISTYKLPNRPWDVTVINSNTAAVTLPDESKIMFMNCYTRKGLCESHSLNVSGRCCGLDNRHGIMAVCFSSPSAVHVQDLTGNILYEVHDNNIILTPFYISLGNDKESIFVSDNGNANVYEFSNGGNIKRTINSQKLKHPKGMMVTSNGTVVVCGSDESGKVSMIVPGTSGILPLMLQYVENPWSVLVCEEQNKMFICEDEVSKDSNYIKIFDLK